MFPALTRPRVQAFNRAKARILAGVLSLCAITSASACPFPPPAVHDIQVMRYDSGTAVIKPEPAILDEREDDASPVRDYLRIVVSEADISFVQETESLGTYRAKCALEWLEVWARADALLGAAKSSDAIAERRGALSGAALAYIKVKPSASPEQAAAVEAWLSKLAITAQFDFAETSTKTRIDRYWLMLSLGATAVATKNDAMWQTARVMMEDAVKTITADGMLPLEPSRPSFALEDQARALMPLTAMAELARSRGEDWYTFNNGALDRLVALTARGIETPDVFKKLSGFDQEQPLNIQSGWLPLYLLERPQGLTDASFEMPSGHAWLGGNVLLLNHALKK